MTKLVIAALFLLSGCALLRPSDETSFDSLRERFRLGLRPAPEQLQAGQEWRCIECAAGTKHCRTKYRNATLLRFDDIFVMAPPTSEEEPEERLVGHAFVYEGNELYSHVYGDGRVAYMRLDPKSQGLIVFNDTATISTYILCDEAHATPKRREAIF